MGVNKPVVSCIIPVRDRRDFVGHAINSVLAQKGSIPVEIVVVDDGSSDGTGRYVESTFPSVRLFSTEGCRGPGFARNLGASKASGQVFMFLDSDDTWHPFHVMQLCRLLEQGGHVAYGVAENIDTLNNETFFIPEPGMAPSGMCLHELLRWCFLVPSAVAVTRQAFEEVGGFSHLAFGEDWEFFLRLGARFDFFHISQIITRRILHAESLCASGNIAEKIGIMLNSLTATLMNEVTCRYHTLDASSVSRSLRRFERMATITAMEGEQWQTVQDWYMSLKRHGLV